MQNHHLSMSGGGENSNYMASIGYMSQDGIMKGPSTKRGNFRLNANTKYFNMLTIGLNTAGSYQTSTEPLSGVWEIFNQIVDHDRPTVPLKYDNGHWGQYDGNPYYTLYQKNPIEETTRTANYKNWKFDGKVYVDLEPIKNLHIRSSFAYQYWNTNYHAFSPNHQHYKADGTYTTTGIVGLTEKTVLNQQWINENIVSYSFDILQNNHFAVLLG